MGESSQVIIGTCRDAAEAALVRAVLTAHAIPVHISGENHARMLGIGGAAITQAIWVPRAQAEDARALLDEMRDGGELVLADDEIPADDQAERAEEVTDEGAVVATADDTLARLGTRKRIVLAVIVGVTLAHGTAHMSTRAWGRGIVLAAVQVMGWWLLATGSLVAGVAVVVTTMVMDVVGATLRILDSDSPLPIARVRRA